MDSSFHDCTEFCSKLSQQHFIKKLKENQAANFMYKELINERQNTRHEIFTIRFTSLTAEMDQTTDQTKHNLHQLGYALYFGLTRPYKN